MADPLPHLLLQVRLARARIQDPRTRQAQLDYARQLSLYLEQHQQRHSLAVQLNSLKVQRQSLEVSVASAEEERRLLRRENGAKEELESFCRRKIADLQASNGCLNEQAKLLREQKGNIETELAESRCKLRETQAQSQQQKVYRVLEKQIQTRKASLQRLMGRLAEADQTRLQLCERQNLASRQERKLQGAVVMLAKQVQFLREQSVGRHNSSASRRKIDALWLDNFELQEELKTRALSHRQVQARLSRAMRFERQLLTSQQESRGRTDQARQSLSFQVQLMGKYTQIIRTTLQIGLFRFRLEQSPKRQRPHSDSTTL